MPEPHQIIDLTLNLPRNPAKPYVLRETGKIRWIVLHHSAGPVTQRPRGDRTLSRGDSWLERHRVQLSSLL